MKNRIIKIDTGNANKGYVAIDQQYEGFWIVVGHEETEETVWIGEDEAARLAAAIRVTGSTRVDCGACIGTGFAGPDQNCAVCDGRGCFTREEMAERQRHVQRWYEQDQVIRELREELRITHAALKLELDSASAVASDERGASAEELEDLAREIDDLWGALSFDYGTMPEPTRKEAHRVVKEALYDIGTRLRRRYKIGWPLSANVSEATRNDSVVAEGVTLPVGEKPALKCHNGMPHYCANCDRSF